MEKSTVSKGSKGSIFRWNINKLHKKGKGQISESVSDDSTNSSLTSSSQTADEGEHHFNIISDDSVIDCPASSRDIPVTLEELSVDKWVIVKYRDEYWIGRIIKVFSESMKAQVKCLEKPYGVNIPQNFEHSKFWVKYDLSKIFKSPVTPKEVNDGAELKWQY